MADNQSAKNQTNELEALFAQLDALAEREEKLHTRLYQADEQQRVHESALQVKIEQLAARGAHPSPVQESPTSENGQRAVHEYLAYRQLVGKIRKLVNATLPREATVIVVSKGDEELVKLGTRAAWHFPRNEQGIYAGYYPSDSADAIRQLENLRARGGEYLLFPSTAFWWLDHYRDFAAHLQQYREIIKRDDVGVIYSLRERAKGQVRAKKKTAARLSSKNKRAPRGKR